MPRKKITLKIQSYEDGSVAKEPEFKSPKSV